MAMPVVFLLMAGLYLAFPVIRSAQLVLRFLGVDGAVLLADHDDGANRFADAAVLADRALAWSLALLQSSLLLWLASRIYRIGMLMYGKKATIPEVMRWVKQA